MSSALVLWCGILTVSLVGQTLPVQRFPAGRPITEADDRELTRLVTPYGQPRLVFEPEGVQLQGNWHAQV